jgi:SAM-dependent methyltransferase
MQKLSPAFLSTVVLPSWLASKYEKEADRIHKAGHSGDPEKAQFILGHLLKGAARKLGRAAPAGGGKSAWTEYMSTNNNYSADHFAAKEKFVRDAMAEVRPKRVLDIGCNNGHFSEIAARSGAAVVGVDYDPVVLGDVWRRAKANSLDILPLAVNVCRPTPAMGWRNEECPSFLERARGAFDCVLMLAVIHHMLVTERVPLPDIIDTIAEITTDHLILEFVGSEDSMFRRIARGRDHLHTGLNEQVFENECRRRFDVVRRQHVPGTERWLYLLRRNSNGA